MNTRNSDGFPVPDKLAQAHGIRRSSTRAPGRCTVRFPGMCGGKQPGGSAKDIGALDADGSFQKLDRKVVKKILTAVFEHIAAVFCRPHNVLPASRIL